MDITTAKQHRTVLTAPIVTTGVGAALMIVALWLPWHVSGARTRNAFDLLHTVSRLDVLPSLVVDLWQVMVVVAPMWGAVMVIAIATDSKRAFVASSLVISTVVGCLAITLTAVLPVVELGEIVALIGLAGVALGLLLMLRERRLSGAPAASGNP